MLADEVINEKSASHILHKQLLSAHEPNLLDEDGKFFHFLNQEITDSHTNIKTSACLYQWHYFFSNHFYYSVLSDVYFIW